MTVDFVVPYCERLTSGSEVINVWSNAGFALCTVFWWLQNRRHGDSSRSRVLVSLTASMPLLIAAGSALYHAWPSPATQALDIGPIALLVVLMLWWLLRSVAQWTRSRCTLAIACWVLGSMACAQWPEFLAGSLFYLPTLAGLLLLTVGVGELPRRHRRTLCRMTLVFAAALSARAADLPVCAHWPVGTHILWHLLTAVVCWQALSLLVPESNRSTAP